ncbi:alanine/glycine:cation symporter family protein [Arenibacterium sp. LLYu02]|uniref:alanine/glycine:cation symporter family protein n=1 Tax=Arenibacterium sp. LLYu02 TaxID=3404132 RepID=UPI003B20D981
MDMIINTASEYLWGYFLTYGLLAAGAYFTLRLGFLQLRHAGEMIRTLASAKGVGREEGGISPFQALSISLASRVGTGNIVGVAVALYLGGAGAIFWMWVVAFLGMATSFAESTLAQLYKTRSEDGSYRGGPEFYIARGLGLPWLGKVFAVLFIFTGLVFGAVQSNSIAGAMNGAFAVSPLVTGLVVSGLVAIVVLGGMSRIAVVAEFVVPFMAGVYVLVTLVVAVMNAGQLPGILGDIVSGAFGLNEAAGGAAGSMTAALMNGVRRGLFSNEAGLGTAPHIAASATPNPHHPAAQGFVQALSVFIDTIVVCTATAILILTSGVMGPDNTLNGVELTQAAFNAHLGGMGPTFVAAAIFLFAGTTIFSSYAFCENAAAILFGSNPMVQLGLKLVIIATTFGGALQAVALVFGLADVFMASLASINLVVILLLSGTVRAMAQDYVTQRKTHTPRLDLNAFPQLRGKVDQEVWGTRSDRG